MVFIINRICKDTFKLEEAIIMKENYIVLDIETTGLNPWYDDVVTCICVKGSKSGHDYHAVSKDEKSLLFDFFEWFKCNYIKDTLLITKNGKAFDIPFLLTRLFLNNALRWEEDLAILKFEHFDLHEVTSKWVRLSDMATLYGVENKSGSGLQAIKLFKDNKLEELKDYCWQDVIVTEQVYKRYIAFHKTRI